MLCNIFNLNKLHEHAHKENDLNQVEDKLLIKLKQKKV